MIILDNISKSYYTKQGLRNILLPTSLKIPSHENIAILGRNGAGKSTLLRMISGVEKPDVGRVIRLSKLSWPIGFGGALHPALTGRQNVEFVARIHSVEVNEAVEFVEDFSQLGTYLDEPVQSYSSGMRAKLAFGLSLSIDFDCYLIDEAISTGDRWFREKAAAAFEARRSRSGMLFVSHNPQMVKRFCDRGIVLAERRLIPFSDIDEAIDFYNFGLLQG